MPEYGLFTASGDPIDFGGSSGIDSGAIFLTRIFVPAGNTISAIKIAVQNANTYSANGVPNQLAVYDDSGTRLGITPDDPTMWSSEGWHTGTLPSSIAAQGADRFVYVGFITGGYPASGISPAWTTSVSGGASLRSAVVNANTNGKLRAMYASSQTALPVSIDPTSYGTPTSFISLLGLVA